jgi:hypothetical protein
VRALLHLEPSGVAVHYANADVLVLHHFGTRARTHKRTRTHTFADFSKLWPDLIFQWVYGFTMSGMHWNMLRGAPFVGITHTGGLQLFRAGHAQTIFEGLLMAVLCTLSFLVSNKKGWS